VRLRTFVLALALARSIRFFGEGYLAVTYGAQAYVYMTAHKVQFAASAILLAAILYLMSRWFARSGSQAPS
jgi:membrane protein implicated in regulation of membrane protease activity